MKLHRLATLPFAFVADVCTLGNIGGDRSFTQQVFDAEDYELRSEAELKAINAVVAAVKEKEAPDAR